jgi:hypothetical protein
VQTHLFRRLPWIFCLLSVAVLPTSAQYNSPAPPTVVIKGPTHKISDIPWKNDLVKLSANWWGLSYEKFPSVVGMKAQDYSSGDSPGSAQEKKEKVVMPTHDFCLKNWTPEELEPLAFVFRGDEGLVEIKAFLPEEKGDANPMASVVKSLVARYGNPSTVEGSPYEPGISNLAVWKFDKTVLEVNSLLFKIYPVRLLQKTTKQ